MGGDYKGGIFCVRSSDNHRRFERINADDLGIVGEICGVHEAMLRDVSIGGASFLVEKPLYPGKNCHIDINADGRTYRLLGSIAWMRNLGAKITDRNETRKFYTVGIRFNNELYDFSARLVEHVLNSRGEHNPPGNGSLMN